MYIPVSFLIIIGLLQLFSLRMILALGLSQTFIMFRTTHSSLVLFGSLVIKFAGFYKGLFCIYWDDHVIRTISIACYFANLAIPASLE